MPVYNGEEFINEAIESVLNQQYSFIELLVVDDGSTDRTADIVKELAVYDNRITYLYQSNSGACSVPRNNGLSKSSGEFITFFDADDIMYPQKIKMQVDCLRGNDDVQVVFCNYRNFSCEARYDQTHFDTCSQLKCLFNANRKDLDETGFILLDSDTASRLLSIENYTISNSPLFRKRAIEMVGGYDPSLKASEDWFLHMKIVSSFKSAVIPFVGFERRMHGNNMSGNKLKMLEYRAITREKAVDFVKDHEARSLLRGRAAFYWYELSRELKLCGKPGAFNAVMNGIKNEERISINSLKALGRFLI